MTSRRCTRKRSGFTLIEMIVATFLLGVGVVGALGAFGAATRASRIAHDAQTAVMLAQKQLSETETQASNLSGGDTEGDFGDQYPGFHWKQSVETSDYQNMFQVTVTVTWGMGASQQQEVLTTYLRNDQNLPPSATSSTSSTSSGGTNGG